MLFRNQKLFGVIGWQATSLLSVRRCNDCVALLHHPPIRLRNNSKFFSCDFLPLRTTRIRYYRTNGHKCTAKASEQGLELSKSISQWTVRPSKSRDDVDRFLFAFFCEASSVNTACGNSVSCIKGINRGHNGRAAGSGRAGNLIGGCSWRPSTLPAAGYINRQASWADFRGWYQMLIAQWHRT